MAVVACALPHMGIEPAEQQCRAQHVGRVAARRVGKLRDDQHCCDNRRKRQRARRAQPQKYDAAEQQHRKYLHRPHRRDWRHHLAETGQHLGVEEFHAIHRQHGMECRRIVRHARAVAATVVGKRPVVGFGDGCLDRAIGIVVQRLRRRIGAFLGNGEIGQHVPIGVGQDDRGQRRQQNVERKSDHPDAHGKAGIQAAADRQHAVGQTLDGVCLRGRPVQHRRAPAITRPGFSRNP